MQLKDTTNRHTNRLNDLPHDKKLLTKTILSSYTSCFYLPLLSSISNRQLLGPVLPASSDVSSNNSQQDKSPRDAHDPQYNG